MKYQDPSKRISLKNALDKKLVKIFKFV